MLIFIISKPTLSRLSFCLHNIYPSLRHSNQDLLFCKIHLHLRIHQVILYWLYTQLSCIDFLPEFRLPLHIYTRALSLY